jgi:hypothetical protein
LRDVGVDPKSAAGGGEKHRERKRKLKPQSGAGQASNATVAAASAPTSTPGLAKSVKPRICTSFLAESSNLFPGFKCTYGVGCKFAHTAYKTVSKEDGLSTLKGAKGKLNDTQAEELKAFIEANCL